MRKRQWKSPGSILRQEDSGEGVPHSYSQGVVECYLVILKENNAPTNCSVLTAPWFAPCWVWGVGATSTVGDFPPPPEFNHNYWERVRIDCAVKEKGAGPGPGNWKGRSRPENICTGSNLIQRLAESSKEHPPTSAGLAEKPPAPGSGVSSLVGMWSTRESPSHGDCKE